MLVTLLGIVTLVRLLQQPALLLGSGRVPRWRIPIPLEPLTMRHEQARQRITATGMRI
jgi:hypothetical protein